MNDLKEYISQLRFDFCKQSLSEDQINSNPFLQFESWFKEAVETHVYSPNAMMLCTASKSGKPAARIMLLRNFDEKGFVFYSNYTSHKAQNMAENPQVALTFFWGELERQVRIEGLVEKQNDAESDSYFAMRPDTSKLGAWASPQSKVIANRTVLDEKYKELKQQFADQPIPRPPFWGGYLVKPTFFEFWQGRPSRLHDRIAFELMNDSQWKISRLAP